jgi:uncharacterized protein
MRVLLYWTLAALALTAAPADYEASVQTWRKEREEKLKAKDGWLSVAGLFWLKEGENRAGSDPSYEIVLPEGRAPRRLGVFDYKDGKTSFRMATGAQVMVNGKPVMTAELKPDTSGSPDLLQFGDFTMFAIKRGSRYGIRMRDLRSTMRQEFSGLQWFPIRPGHRIVAKFVSYPKMQTLPVPNVLGEIEQQPTSGYAEFKLGGRTHRLHPVLEEDQLFFIFKDQTSGRTTYGAGRFLYSDLPKDGKVVLDFNKAYNPPCAYTPYATCPLPPKQNRLNVKVEAGELNYGNH